MEPQFNADPGPVYLPGSDRYVWWTGRVAIGIRHQQRRDLNQPVPESELWIQDVLLTQPKPANVRPIRKAK